MVMSPEEKIEFLTKAKQFEMQRKNDEIQKDLMRQLLKQSKVTEKTQSEVSKKGTEHDKLFKTLVKSIEVFTDNNSFFLDKVNKNLDILNKNISNLIKIEEYKLKSSGKKFSLPTLTASKGQTSINEIPNKSVVEKALKKEGSGFSILGFLFEAVGGLGGLISKGVMIAFKVGMQGIFDIITSVAGLKVAFNVVKLIPQFKFLLLGLGAIALIGDDIKAGIDEYKKSGSILSALKVFGTSLFEHLKSVILSVDWKGIVHDNIVAPIQNLMASAEKDLLKRLQNLGEMSNSLQGLDRNKYGKYIDLFQQRYMQEYNAINALHNETDPKKREEMIAQIDEMNKRNQEFLNEIFEANKDFMHNLTGRNLHQEELDKIFNEMSTSNKQSGLMNKIYFQGAATKPYLATIDKNMADLFQLFDNAMRPVATNSGFQNASYSPPPRPPGNIPSTQVPGTGNNSGGGTVGPLLNPGSLKQPHGADYYSKYGDPNSAGFDKNIVSVTAPWNGKDGKPFTVRVHKDAARDTAAAFADVWNQAGQDQNKINEWGLNILGDSYNNRNVAGTDRKSSHAWGMAIDFDPRRNPMLHHRHSQHNIPDSVIDTFEKHRIY